MRIVRVVTAFMLCVFVCAGCAKEGGDFLDYQNNIKSASVTWSIGDREYSGKIEYGQEDTVVTALSPVEIEGTIITYTDEGCTATVGGVCLPLPDNMGREVYRIVHSLSLEKSEMKGAGEGSGTETAVRFESALYGSVTEYNIVYNDDKMPATAKITWDDGEMYVRYDGFDG